MREFDPYFNIDLFYEREQQEAEDKEEYISSKVEEMLGDEWGGDFDNEVVEAVKDKISGFDDAQWAVLERVLIDIALGHTVSASDTEKLISYDDLYDIAEKRVVEELTSD